MPKYHIYQSYTLPSLQEDVEIFVSSWEAKVVLPTKNRNKRFASLRTIGDGPIIGVDLLPVKVTRKVNFTHRQKPFIHGRVAKRDEYIGTYSISAAVFFPVELRIYYLPIYLPYPMSITELSFNCDITDSGKNTIIGIYPLVRGVIGKLLFSNTVTLNVTGPRAITTDMHLGEGTYVLVYFSESAQVAGVKGISHDIPILGYANNTGTSQSTHFRETGVFITGLLDNPTPSLATGNCPHIFAKVG